MVMKIEDVTCIEQLIVYGSGGQCTDDYNDKTKPFVARGVVKRKEIHQCIKEGRSFYYTDTGYFGNFKSEGNSSGKKKWVRIVKNELQKSTLETWPSDRWDALVKLDKRLEWKGWKTNGNKILLVTPNPKSCHYFGFELDDWKNKTIAEIKKHTDMPIIIREKASRSERHANSIYDALDQGIFATVTFNSIAAIESIAYGIPAFVAVPCAASPLALTDLSKIATPYYPDESLVKKQCYSLAYGQFRGDEIENGTAWKILQRNSK
jgi:hypothetical protein